MNVIDLHAASREESERLWPAVKAAHLFRDRDAFLAARDRAPWRVRVDARERAAVLERWRPHLDIMAVRALWAPARDVEAVVRGLAGVTRSQGLRSLLSPLIAEDTAGPYLRAGLHPHASIVALRIDGREALRACAPVPEGLRVRRAGEVDCDAIAAVDAACFEPFWAYDGARLAEAVRTDRVAVAESSAGIIGYTLSTIERGSGTLGRLGVLPRERGHGVGAALLAESLCHMAQAGAGSISLCTQEENAVSRSLYTRLGLRELPGRLLLLLGDA